MAGFVSSTYVTRQSPCVICGKPDWCSVIDFGMDGKLHYCHRVSQKTVAGYDGETYYNKATKKHPTGVTEHGAYIYESVRQKEQNDAAFLEKKRRENPNYQMKNGCSLASDFAPIPKIKERVVVDSVMPLSNKKLNSMYRYLLSLLVLEEEHEVYLKSEWNAGYDKSLAERILNTFPIRSLPMNDQARKLGGYQLKNRTRKEIIASMIERFGSLRGLPGFFVKDGEWQMVYLSGIVYPEYDADGYIYRIRVMDEHPHMVEYLKASDGSYLYETDIKGNENKVIGAEYFFSQKNGEWYRKDRNGNLNCVFSIPKKIQKVSITPKGYPKVDGKVDGKYKNFSSYTEGIHETDDKLMIYNKYQDGCQSGSNIGLYCKEGDNFQFVYITEGEKKAMVINQLLNCPVISLPGVNTYAKVFQMEYQKEYSMFEKLLERGATHFIIVYDADKNTNKAVLDAENGVVNMCKEKGVTTLISSWDPRYGKGADDILISGKRFRCSSV